MSLQIHIGGSWEDDERRLLDVTRRIERGEAVAPEAHLSFADWPSFFKSMTPSRIQIMQHVHDHDARSILALSKALNRGYRRTYDDVQALIRAGLLSRRADGSLSADADIGAADIAACTV